MLKRFCALTLVGGTVVVAYWWYSIIFTPFLSTGALEIHILDVGQGDATLIQTPNGHQILVDASRGRAVIAPLQEILPIHDKVLDAVVLTHPDADHIGGFVPILDMYEVSRAFHADVPFDGTQVARHVSELLQEEITTPGHIALVDARHAFVLDGVHFNVLWPFAGVATNDKNYASVTLLVSYGDMKALLTGDAPKSVEHTLVRTFPEETADVDILKLGHHGSKTSTAPAFLEHTKPNAVIVSAGEHNSYGHPHEEVLATIERYNQNHPDEPIAVHETKDGTVSFCLTPKRARMCAR